MDQSLQSFVYFTDNETVMWVTDNNQSVIVIPNTVTKGDPATSVTRLEN